MKATPIASYGASDLLQLAECERPNPGPGQYLIKVRASAVNPVDWKLRRGSLKVVMHPSFPLILGFDVCGEIVEAGPGAHRFKPGDAIYVRLDNRFGGALAEYAVAGEGAVASKPAGLTALQAAAVPLAGMTALQGLRDLGKLQAGQQLLVVGGSGGVGHFAVQIGKALGATVVASCSTGNVEMVRSLGADHVIDYRKEPYRVIERAYDVVYDTVVAEPFSTFAPLMAPRGRFVAATPSLGLLLRAPFLPLYSGKRILFVSLKSRGSDLEYLTGLIEQGRLKPVIDRTFALAEAAQAHAYAEQGHVRGKVVIDVAANA